MRTPLVLLAGAALGITFIWACGDGSPGHVDAATCDCPAAEPPLAGRIVVVTETTTTIHAQTSDGGGNTCPVGATLLSGSCRLQAPGPLLTLSESGIDDGNASAWDCEWNNPTAQDAIGRVKIICLLPAQ